MYRRREILLATGLFDRAKQIIDFIYSFPPTQKVSSKKFDALVTEYESIVGQLEEDEVQQLSDYQDQQRNEKWGGTSRTH